MKPCSVATFLGLDMYLPGHPIVDPVKKKINPSKSVSLVVGLFKDECNHSFYRTV
jgi:hypothetical protein